MSIDPLPIRTLLTSASICKIRPLLQEGGKARRIVPSSPNAAGYFVGRTLCRRLHMIPDVLGETALTLGWRDEANRAVAVLMVVPAQQCRQRSGRIATARVQPADAARILTGKQETMKPVDGKASRL